MGLTDILFIGVGLSMDAFAVSICKGLKMKVIDIKQCLLIATFFGGFQAIMPTIGYLLSSNFCKVHQCIQPLGCICIITFNRCQHD